MFGRKSTATALDQVLESLRRTSAGQLAWSAREPARAARYAAPAEPLSEAMRRALANSGIEQLYAHQAEAIDVIRSGRNAAIVTPTASGKTLGFTIPVIERLMAHPTERALYLYPTNALVNDQERGLRSLLGSIPAAPAAAVLTGATNTEDRRAYRSQPPQILLTNPEMLHMSLLGQHRYWHRYFRGLRFIVLDELHMYRGLFGAHMAMVIRRLLRVAAMYGAAPRLIACSATIGNPGEMAARITGRPFVVVEGSGAARGERSFIVWRPPLVRGAKDGERTDPQAEAVNLFCRMVSEGLGSILFALTRRGAETMLIQARARLGPALAERIAPYRSGYSPEQRREVEERLKRGDLLGVVSTNALEVGIDIGGLDVAIIAGFPGSRTSLWQQAGRAGRGTRGSAVALVPYERVVDAYYAANPEDLLSGRFEDAIVDLENPRIAASHLVCAAAEAVLTDAEAAFLSPVSIEALRLAAADGRLRRTVKGWSSSDEGAHRVVGLRGSTARLLQIGGPAGDLGTIDLAHALREAHPGAIYLHEGERYRVRSLDVKSGRVETNREPGLLVTEPLVQGIVHVERVDRRRALRSCCADVVIGSGAVILRQTTTGYREVRLRGKHPVRTEVLQQALSYEMATFGCWLVVPDPVRKRLEGSDPRRFGAGLHALEHLLPSAVSLRSLCDARDVIATYEIEHETMSGPTLFLLDDCEGGAGIATRAYEIFEDLLASCAEIVRSCKCRDGCPACILSAACWRQYDDVDKSAALSLIVELLDQPLNGTSV